MTWAKVDDQWFAHRKVVGLSLAARGLWTTVLSWSCAQRSPHVPVHMVRFLTCGEDIDVLAGELVAAGLWIAEDGGWRIHDWDEYQDASLSEKRADAGRKGGLKSGQTRRQTPVDTPPDEASGKQTKQADEANGQAGALPVPALPDLSQTPSSTDVDREAAEIGPDDAADDPDPVEETFEQFWQIYPPRNGRKDGKGNALIEWRKLTLEERRRAYRGAKHLAASDQLPKDAERFLRRAKGGKGDFPFDDWQEAPASAGPDGKFFGGVADD